MTTALLQPSPSSPRGYAIEQREHSTAWFIRQQRRKLLMLGVATTLTCLLFVLLVLQLQIVSTVVFLVLVVLTGIAWRPRIGLYVMFALGLLVENLSPDPLMLPGKYLPIQFMGLLI